MLVTPIEATTATAPLDDLLMNEISSTYYKKHSDNHSSTDNNNNNNKSNNNSSSDSGGDGVGTDNNTSGLVSVLDEFSTFDKSEPEDYATCQFKLIQISNDYHVNNDNNNNKNNNNNDHNTINMWQTSKGRGPLHIHIRLDGISNTSEAPTMAPKQTTTTTPTPATTIKTIGDETNGQHTQTSSLFDDQITTAEPFVRTRRESYQAPVERESDQMMANNNVVNGGQSINSNNNSNSTNYSRNQDESSEATATSINAHRQTTRHEVWLHHALEGNIGAGNCGLIGPKMALLSEIRSDAGTGEVDAEIIVPHLNLTGNSHTISSKYLVVYSAKSAQKQQQTNDDHQQISTRSTQVPIGCCLVTVVDKLPNSDDSPSLIQPIPESTLKSNVKNDPNNLNITTTTSSSAFTTPTKTLSSNNNATLMIVSENTKK